jgi:hypothetical protein
MGKPGGPGDKLPVPAGETRRVGVPSGSHRGTWCPVVSEGASPWLREPKAWTGTLGASTLRAGLSTTWGRGLEPRGPSPKAGRRWKLTHSGVGSPVGGGQRCLGEGGPPWGIGGARRPPPARSGLTGPTTACPAAQGNHGAPQATTGGTHASRGRKEEKSGKRWDCIGLDACKC